MVKITNIDISGFLTFRDFSLNLNDKNIIVGTNGTGKSNFMKILDLMINNPTELSKEVYHNGNKYDERYVKLYIELYEDTTNNGAPKNNEIIINFMAFIILNKFLHTRQNNGNGKFIDFMYYFRKIKKIIIDNKKFNKIILQKDGNTYDTTIELTDETFLNDYVNDNKYNNYLANPSNPLSIFDTCFNEININCEVYNGYYTALCSIHNVPIEHQQMSIEKLNQNISELNEKIGELEHNLKKIIDEENQQTSNGEDKSKESSESSNYDADDQYSSENISDDEIRENIVMQDSDVDQQIKEITKEIGDLRNEREKFTRILSVKESIKKINNLHFVDKFKSFIAENPSDKNKSYKIIFEAINYQSVIKKYNCGINDQLYDNRNEFEKIIDFYKETNSNGSNISIKRLDEIANNVGNINEMFKQYLKLHIRKITQYNDINSDTAIKLSKEIYTELQKPNVTNEKQRDPYDHKTLFNKVFELNNNARSKYNLLKMKNADLYRFIDIKEKFKAITGKEFDIKYDVDKILDIECVITINRHQYPCSSGENDLINFLAEYYSSESDVLLIDEPCVRLSSQNKINFRKQLLEEDEENKPNKQLIMITHDPQMISEKTCENMIRFELNNNMTKERLINAISSADRKLIFGHKDVLFAKRCLLVEGYTDYLVMKNILNFMENKAIGYNDYLIDICIGKTSRLPFVLNKLNIDHKIIYDSDVILKLSNNISGDVNNNNEVNNLYSIIKQQYDNTQFLNFNEDKSLIDKINQITDLESFNSNIKGFIKKLKKIVSHSYIIGYGNTLNQLLDEKNINDRLNDTNYNINDICRSTNNYILVWPKEIKDLEGVGLKLGIFTPEEYATINKNNKTTKWAEKMDVVYAKIEDAYNNNDPIINDIINFLK